MRSESKKSFAWLKKYFFFQNVQARHFDVVIFHKDPKTGQVTFAIRRNNIEHQTFDRGYCYTRNWRHFQAFIIICLL